MKIALPFQKVQTSLSASRTWMCSCFGTAGSRRQKRTLVRERHARGYVGARSRQIDPFVVTMDCKGNSRYNDVKVKAREIAEDILSKKK